MTTTRDITNYALVDDKSEVKLMIPNDPDGEWLHFQFVFPVINGKEYKHVPSYRFIRVTKDGKWKPQMGQAQVPDFTIMAKLIAQMSVMRGISIADSIIKLIAF